MTLDQARWAVLTEAQALVDALAAHDESIRDHHVSTDACPRCAARVVVDHAERTLVHAVYAYREALR